MVERLVRVVQKNVALGESLENLALVQLRNKHGRKGLVVKVAQLRVVAERSQIAHAQRPIHAVHIRGFEAQGPAQEGFDLGRGIAGDFQAHGLAALAFA